MKIGKYLKKLRLEKGLSIRDIAKKIELSPAAWSNIERDVNSPTLVTLTKICDALNIHMVDLLQQCEQEEPEKILFRKSERHSDVTSEDSDIRYELISAPKNKFQILSVTMDKKCDYGYVSKKFPSDEIALVLKGKMQLQIDHDVYTLDEGDTIYLKAGLEYTYRNPSSDPCEVIWAIQGIDKLELSD